jgi:hypothetical protein
LEVKYSRRLYGKATPSRSDITKTISSNTSYIFPFSLGTGQITGYLDYQYTTNNSDNKYYSFRGYGPTGIITLPLSNQTGLRLILSQETRNYETGYTDRSVIIMPNITNKKLEPVRIFIEYSYQKNNSGSSDRKFIQNKLGGGLTIIF